MSGFKKIAFDFRGLDYFFHYKDPDNWRITRDHDTPLPFYSTLEIVDKLIKAEEAKG